MKLLFLFLISFSLTAAEINGAGIVEIESIDPMIGVDQQDTEVSPQERQALINCIKLEKSGCSYEGKEACRELISEYLILGLTEEDFQRLEQQDSRVPDCTGGNGTSTIINNDKDDLESELQRLFQGQDHIGTIL